VQLPKILRLHWQLPCHQTLHDNGFFSGPLLCFCCNTCIAEKCITEYWFRRGRGTHFCVRVCCVFFGFGSHRRSFCTFSTLIQMSIESRVELSPLNAPSNPSFSQRWYSKWIQSNVEDKQWRRKPISLNISKVLSERLVFFGRSLKFCAFQIAQQMK